MMVVSLTVNTFPCSHGQEAPSFLEGMKQSAPQLLCRRDPGALPPSCRIVFPEGMELGALYLKESPPFFGCQRSECKRLGHVNARGL